MKKLSLQRGFTLVEMVVALGIFTIVALVAIGSLVRITDANKKSITLKTTINNLNFALESLSREMRVGSKYYCSNSGTNSVNPADVTTPTGCPNGIDADATTGNWTVAFRSSRRFPEINPSCNLVYAYRYNAGTLYKGEQTDCNDPITQTEFQPLISSDITIENTIVAVTNSGGVRPKAFFWLKGYSGAREKERTRFEVQTSVSQRSGAN